MGQAEVEIAARRTTLVVEAPGMGDEVQAIGLAILEIGDILVVNKADRPGVERTVRALEMMLEIENDSTLRSGITVRCCAWTRRVTAYRIVRKTAGKSKGMMRRTAGG